MKRALVVLIIAVLAFALYGSNVQSGNNLLPVERTGSNTNLLTLRANLASALNGGNLATVVVIGDSISQGSGATSNAVSWSAQLVGEMQSRYGDGGPGFCATTGSPSCNLTPTGTWNGIAVGPNQTGLNAFQEVKQGTSTSTYAVTFGPVDTIDVIYYEVSGGTATSCSGTASGSGGSTQTFGGSDQTFHIITFSSLAKTANHTMTITSQDGNCAIFGVMGRYSGGGPTLFNVAQAGARTDAFATSTQLNWLSLVPGLSLIIIELGQNDPGANTQAQSLANIQGILNQNAALTAPVPILFLLAELPQTDTGQAALYAQEKGLAQQNAFDWVSIGDRWGSYANGNALGLYADTIHPSQEGQFDIVSAVDTFFGLLHANSQRSGFFPSLAYATSLGSGGMVPGIHQQFDGSAARYIFDGYNAPGFTLKNLNTPGTVFTMQINGNGAAQGSDAAGVSFNSVMFLNGGGLEGISSAPSVSNASCTGATIGANATNLAGTITGLPTGACTVKLNFNTATAAHAWTCAVSDETTGNLFRVSTSDTTSVTFTGTSASGDTLIYGPCGGY